MNMPLYVQTMYNNFIICLINETLQDQVLKSFNWLYMSQKL